MTLTISVKVELKIKGYATLANKQIKIGFSILINEVSTTGTNGTRQQAHNKRRCSADN